MELTLLSRLGHAALVLPEARYQLLIFLSDPPGQTCLTPPSVSRATAPAAQCNRRVCTEASGCGGLLPGAGDSAQQPRALERLPREMGPRLPYGCFVTPGPHRSADASTCGLPRCPELSRAKLSVRSWPHAPHALHRMKVRSIRPRRSRGAAQEVGRSKLRSPQRDPAPDGEVSGKVDSGGAVGEAHALP